MVNKLALLPFIVAGVAAQQSGVTTRYWDCCKPSCGWTGKASVSKPVSTCDKAGNVLDPSVKSGCDSGGTAFTCTNYSPFAVDNNTAYGFAAVRLSGQTESSWCCACYELTFTSGPVSGKKMIVQATNTGGDLGNNHFDILMPGGGVGEPKVHSPKDAQRSSVVGTGVLNTEVSPAVINATSSQLLSSLDASGASTGSKAPTTPALPSSPFHAPLSSRASPDACVTEKENQYDDNDMRYMVYSMYIHNSNEVDYLSSLYRISGTVILKLRAAPDRYVHIARSEG
ncbi:hypothetical protein AAF712_004881 [Marasmius tenuissimus]|uniref:Cellulase n=1 Tax=Marasmius tenuissimus TaxID=585030 RepID=A0ABR3A2V1_9AGAR